MRLTRHVRSTLALVVLSLLAPATAGAQVHVLSSGGFRAALLSALPAFERTTGITVTTSSGSSQGTGANRISTQLERGATADVVIMSREGLDELVAAGRVAPDSLVDLARSPLGVGVRAGAPKPDIRTVAAFRRALVDATSVTLQSTSAIYLTTTLLPKLGIADLVAKKSSDAGPPAVASGAVALAILPISEIVHAPGLDYVGPLPDEIQFISVFAAAIVSGSSHQDASRRLLAFLASEAADAAVLAAGMERPAR